MKSDRILKLMLGALLWLAPAASAATFEWVTIGDPGNACDPQSFGCYGAVGYTYRIATHEVTNAQYAEFLNAKAASDPLGLYSTKMSAGNGGITRSGSDGSYTYNAIAGRESKPVNRVSFFDALRFANWLHNGQGDGDTETGAYTLLGGTPTPSNLLVQRNPDATIWLATDVGSYPGSSSPNGTFDQSGNASEWTDGDVGVLENRTIRGGAYITSPNRLDAEIREYDDPWFESAWVTFRVATVADGAICGDAVCESDEDSINCPVDCPDVCGDGLCTGGEDLSSCPADCACTADADCDDGVFCNGAEFCSGGACHAGAVVDCDDGVGCTIDSCDEAADACEHDPLDAACEDLSFCNGDEWCDPVFDCQAGTPVECDDGVGCTTDFCYEALDICMHTPDDSVCDNGVFCDGAEVCDPDFDCQAGTDPCDGEACDETTQSCESSCQPRWGPCSQNSDCCSNRCLRFWGLCR